MKERQSSFARMSPLGRWTVAAAVSIGTLATSAGLLAQPWSGGSTLGVQIRGAEGPIEDAVVEIRYRRPGIVAGPESRRTDRNGQANFVGIAQGRWSLEIRHPDYLAFVASVNVGLGKKTDVVTQFLEASGPGRKTFRVKFLRSDRSLGEAVPGTATQEAAKSRPAPPPRTAPTPKPAPPPAPRPPAALPEPQVDPVPATPPAPTPSREAQAPRELGDRPTPDPIEAPDADVGTPGTVAPAAPAPFEPPVPEAGPIELEPVDPVPGPEVPQAASPEAVAQPAVGTQALTETAPVPAPPPSAAEPSSPPASPGAESPASRLTSFRDRTCFECKPGEWAVAAEIEVPAGEPCRSTGEVAVRRAMRDVAAAVSAELAGFSGPMPTDFEVPPLSLASAAARNTLAPYLDTATSCRFLAIVVPEGGRFTGFRLEASDTKASGTCTGDQACEIGQARFLFSPALARSAGATVVYTVFENTALEIRTARMTGFFLPPSGWTPE